SPRPCRKCGVLSGARPHRRRSTGGSVCSHTPVLENHNGNEKEEHEEGDEEGHQEVFGAQGRAEVRWRKEEDLRAQEEHREEGYAEADDQEGFEEARVTSERLHRCTDCKKAGEIFAGLFASCGAAQRAAVASTTFRRPAAPLRLARSPPRA